MFSWNDPSNIWQRRPECKNYLLSALALQFPIFHQSWQQTPWSSYMRQNVLPSPDIHLQRKNCNYCEKTGIVRWLYSWESRSEGWRGQIWGRWSREGIRIREIRVIWCFNIEGWVFCWFICSNRCRLGFLGLFFWCLDGSLLHVFWQNSSQGWASPYLDRSQYPLWFHLHLLFFCYYFEEIQWCWSRVISEQRADHAIILMFLETPLDCIISLRTQNYLWWALKVGLCGIWLQVKYISGSIILPMSSQL